MVLFLRRDWAGGAGPVVDWPRAGFVPEVVGAAEPAAGAAVDRDGAAVAG